MMISSMNLITLQPNIARARPLLVNQDAKDQQLYDDLEICIQAGNGQYFSVYEENLNQVIADGSTCGIDQTFRIQRSDQRGFAIYHLMHKTYLSCQPNGRLEGNRHSIGSWEEFQIHKHEDSTISLQCLKHGGRYIVAEGNGGRIVNANRKAIGSWEKFRVVIKESNGIQSLPQHKPFPSRWGTPPQKKNSKVKRLPYGYGHGSEELAKWILERFTRDLHSGHYQTALRSNDSASSMIANIGREAFNEAFRQCPIVRYIRNGKVMVIYQRTRSIPEDFDAFAIFTDTWRDKPANRLNHDFVLYDDHYALLRGEQPWTFCNYNDPDVAFPRDCGKTRSVGNRWFSMPGGRFNARGVSQGITFEVHTAKYCPVHIEQKEPERINLVKNPKFNQKMKYWIEYAHGPRINGMHTHTWGPNHKTGHLHGNCPSTAGGISQTLLTQSGASYVLSFDVYSGDWDGKDTDSVRVSAGDLNQLIDVEASHSVNLRNPQKAKSVKLTFKAAGPRTQLSFYADRGHCIDVDNVHVFPIDTHLSPIRLR